jgi:hypothetical protein
MIGDRWGVTTEETRASYACDQYVPEARLQAWRGVTIAAPVRVVWSWLIQVRLAPYSYDLLDNRGRRSPRELLHLDDPEVGDAFSASAGRPLGRVVALRHEDHLTAQIMGATMTYRLTAVDDTTTRLVLKVVGTYPWFLVPVLSIGDLVMARRQLLNLKACAERASSVDRDNP